MVKVGGTNTCRQTSDVPRGMWEMWKDGLISSGQQQLHFQPYSSSLMSIYLRAKIKGMFSTTHGDPFKRERGVETENEGGVGRGLCVGGPK